MRAVMHGIVVVKTGKQQLQQILANLPDRARGRHVVRITIVKPPNRCVGRKQFRHELVVDFFRDGRRWD